MIHLLSQVKNLILLTIHQYVQKAALSERATKGGKALKSEKQLHLI